MKVTSERFRTLRTFIKEPTVESLKDKTTHLSDAYEVLYQINYQHSDKND